MRVPVLLVLLSVVLLAGCSSAPERTYATFYPDQLSHRLELGWWASSPLSVEEIERKSIEELGNSERVPRVPFGFANAEWESLKSRIRPGDILVEIGFSRLLGDGSVDLQSGYALVRDDRIIAEIVTWVT